MYTLQQREKCVVIFRVPNTPSQRATHFTHFHTPAAFDGVVLCSIFAPKATLTLSKTAADNVLVAADTNGNIRFFANKQELHTH